MSTSRLPSLLTVSSMSEVISSKFRTSHGMARALPPASSISRATVLIVDWDEFGSGGNGLACDASDVVFADTTTMKISLNSPRMSLLYLHLCSRSSQDQ